MCKESPAMREMQETLAQSPCWEDPLEEGMASHSSVLAWKSRGQRSLEDCNASQKTQAGLSD